MGESTLLRLVLTQWGVIAAVAAVVLVASACDADALELARDGRTDYRIVVASDAIEPEMTAARELRDHLKQVTRAEFTICTEASAGPGSARILVGPSRGAKQLLPEVDWTALGHDGIVMRTAGKHLVLAGGRPRGTLYAVYSFLEDVVGCRWWASDASFVPKKRTLRIPELRVTYIPRLIYREAFYRGPIEDPVLAARLKLNGHFYRIPPEYGSHYSIIGWCHTFFGMLPPDRYFAEHPDWYSEINGKRTADGAQLCLTNKGALRELTRVALKEIRKDPSAGIISVSQNDWHGRCECAKCLAVEKEEGSPAGPLIRFVNSVAEEVEKEFPGVLVETLAYQYTRKPPLKVKPRQNVVVRLCTIECSFTHILDSDANASFRDDMRKWSAIAPNLYVWDYVTNFASYILPQPNMRVLAPNLRFFAANRAIGIFEQGDCATSVGDFVRLRAWLLAHLLWDQSRDEKALTDEFLRGYYGPAGRYLGAYLDLVHDARERAGSRIGCYNGDTSFLTLDDMAEATRLFAKAEEAVEGNAALVRRVRRERMPLDHVWLLRYEELKQRAADRGVRFPGPADPAAACDEFIALAREWDARNYSEGMAFESYVPGLKTRFAPPPPPPAAFADLPPEDVKSFQCSGFRLFGMPGLSAIVEDPAASNGAAARMPGHHGEWAVQFHVTEDVARDCPGAWDCYLIARCEPGASGSASFRCGIYDNATRREVMSIPRSVERPAENVYRTYYLGTHDLNAGMYIWVAPPGTADALSAIYIDRVVLVRAKGG